MRTQQHLFNVPKYFFLKKKPMRLLQFKIDYVYR